MRHVVAMGIVCVAVAIGAGGAWAKGAKAGGKVVTATTKSPQARAAFDKAETFFDNQQRPEGIAELKKAVKLDPAFARALAQLGANTPGPEGTAMIEKAVELSAKLPEAERLTIEQIAAGRKGDAMKVNELRLKIAELAPDDWRVQNGQAMVARNQHRYEESVDSAKKAIAANPNSAPIYNSLAYAYAGMHKWDDAVAAAKKQAQLLPKEPNPQDTLGEILLWAGRFPEAEAAFQSALKLSPKFSFSWQGVALSRFYRGDSAGAYEALAKQKQSAALPEDKLAAELDAAWAKTAEGKLADGLAAAEAMEKEALAQKEPIYAFGAVDRAWMNYFGQKYPEAIAAATEAMDRASKSDYPEGTKAAVRREALIAKACAEARGGKPADAEKTLADIEGEGKKLPAESDYQANVAWVRATVAVAKGDAKGADAAYETCAKAESIPCIADSLRSREKAGDQAGAKKAREALTTQYYRDFRFAALRPKS